jgi:DnaJ-class molecular chaperone
LDHYQVLQVSRRAEPEVIERAYRALSLKYHPDVVSERQREDAHRRMQRINEAYRVLSDPKARRAYDAQLPAAASHSAWDTFMNKGLVGMFLDKMGTGG